MRKILIVDDDTRLRTHLAEILREAGYHVAEAVSGRDAVDKASADDFDVVLLDMMMPKGDGLEALSYLKKFTPRSRIIMLTAFATVENAVDAMKRGVSHYLSKPFKIEELLTAIRRAIEESRYESCGNQEDLEGILSCLSNATRTKIMRMLTARKRMRLREISKELAMEDHTKVLFHIRIMKQAGLVEQDKEKNYSLTGEGERTMGCLKILEAHIRSSP